ncbi:MAG: response regulator [Candidatus Thiodiazotropha sp.]|jgi:putative two-component system response regulator
MTDTSSHYILAVDDTPASLRLLTDILSSEGYQVRSAINGELALRAAKTQAPQLILLDISMPEMDGFEVCRHLKRVPKLRDVPVIFVSALSEMQDKLEGFDIGGVDYVTKPFQREELLARVHTHIELHRLQNHLEEMVEERTQSLMESERRLTESLLESVSAVAAMVELRDPYTAGHQRNVAQLAHAIANELGLSEHMIEGIKLASVVHDVGKISISSTILTKPGHLTEDEFDLIHQHPELGYEILKGIDFPWPIAQTVWQHHERLDGSGYPHGLQGDEILLEARIIAVADVIEAMATNRPYRLGLGIEKALEEVEQYRGKKFDAEVVDAALILFREKGYQLESVVSATGAIKKNTIKIG